jgi:hypothetical protein
MPRCRRKFLPAFFSREFRDEIAHSRIAEVIVLKMLRFGGLTMNPFLFAAVVALTAVTTSALADDRSARPSGEAEIALMDTNHDGRLSADEHAAGAKTMFAKMDADHDGKVTAAEMDAAQKSMPTSSSESHNKRSSADKIKVVDGNGDGILSAEEHAAGSTRMFEKMDKDRDGTLTAAEISAGHKTMMKKTN